MRPELERRLAVLIEPLERGVLDGVHELESEPERVRVELGVVLVFLDERPLTGLAGLLDWRGCGRLSAVVRSSFFVGAFGDQLLTTGERRWPVDRLVLVGAGPRAEFNDARARELGGRCVEIASGLAAASVLIALPSGTLERGALEIAFEAMLDAIQRRTTTAPQPESTVVALPVAAIPELVEPAPDSHASGEEQVTEAESASITPIESSEPEPRGPEPALDTAPDPVEATPDQPAIEPEPAIREIEWWVVADESIVARLRRVRSGPPRPARSGPSLHT